MREDRPSLFVRLLRGLDGLRRFLVNVLFFGLMAGLAAAAMSGRPKVPDGAALVVKPQGDNHKGDREMCYGTVTTRRSSPVGPLGES